MSTATIPAQRGNVPALKTRQPTGKPPWPMMLLAGAEKSGKSYSLAQASASQHIGRTFWVGMGEDSPDEYGAIPGARFEIVEHDGTYRGILAAFTAAVAQPRTDGKPNLIGGDSMTRLWDLVCGMAQVEANRRAAAKAARQNRPAPDEDALINMDLWNAAKGRWEAVIDVLRAHDGPVVLTARLEQVTVMNDRGEPTKDKTQKVKAEKSLPYDVGVIVEMPARGKTFLTGVRSLRFKPDPTSPERTEYTDFTVEKLWADLGLLEEGATSPRRHDANLADRTEHIALINEIAVLADRAGIPRKDVGKGWADTHDGQSLMDATAKGDLELLRDDLKVQAELKERQDAIGVQTVPEGSVAAQFAHDYDMGTAPV